MLIGWHLEGNNYKQYRKEATVFWLTDCSLRHGATMPFLRARNSRRNA